MNLNDYIDSIKSLRKAKKLHNVIQEKLVSIMKIVSNEYHPIKEIQGLAGGRNDLLLFEYSGKKILFEIFASSSQVSRDLRILDNTNANTKVAVIIDKEVDKNVFERFLRENPERNYPFIFMQELMQEKLYANTILKLKYFISKDENLRLQIILKKHLSFSSFIATCKQEGINLITNDDISSNTITFKMVFLTILSHKLLQLTLNRKLTKNVVKYVSEDKVYEYITMKILVGMNTLLFTDLNEHIEICSDIELLDWLRIFNELEKPYIILSINNIFNEIIDKYYKKKDKLRSLKKIKIYIGQSQVFETKDGCHVTFSIPRNATKIHIFRPLIISKTKAKKNLLNEEKEIADYRNMIEII